MNEEHIGSARERRARLDRLAGDFVGHFMVAGARELAAEPAIPTQDRTILFTNSAVVPFKPFLRGERPLEPRGVVVRQPCVRAHNLRAVFAERFPTEFLLQFEMLGALVPAAHGAELAASVARYFSQVLGLGQEEVALRVTSDDGDLIEHWTASWSGPVLLDTEKRSYYRWGFGDPRLTGRGSTLAIGQGDGTFRDLGNLIAFACDDTVVGYGFGIGLETLAVCLDRHPWVLHSVPAGAVPPPTTPDEGKLADLLGLLVRLYAYGVRVSSRAQGHVLRKAVNYTARLATRLGVDEDELLDRVAALASVEAPDRDIAGMVRADLVKMSTEEFTTYRDDLSFWCPRKVTPDELAAAAADVSLDGVVGLTVEVKDVWDADPTRPERSVTLAVAADIGATGAEHRKAALRQLVGELAQTYGVRLRGEIR